MGEEEEDKAPRKVGEMAVDEFFTTLLHILHKRNAKGDPRLIELSVKDFTDLILEQMKTRSYGAAQAEVSVAERILTDWRAIEAVGAVTQPFRVSTAEEAARLGQDLGDFFIKGGRGQMVVAIAVAAEEGGYRQFTNV